MAIDVVEFVVLLPFNSMSQDQSKINGMSFIQVRRLAGHTIANTNLQFTR